MAQSSTQGRHRDRRSLSPSGSRRLIAHDEQRNRSPHIKRRGPEHTNKHNLPYGQRSLSKHELKDYEALFADYLQLQKHLTLSGLGDSEVKGRWKSFIGKWNRGELAEGWYDPAVLQRAVERSTTKSYSAPTLAASTSSRPGPAASRANEPEDSEDDDLGPHLPNASLHSHGPAMPNLQDLQYQREAEQQNRANQRLAHQHERKQQRKTDKERLEELAPRAAPGSRERQLEKKRDVALSKKALADARESGAAEIADNDLLGEDGIDAFKAKIRTQERQKNERELRKEEVLRARAAEREERLAEHRRKEAKTMETLRALAQQRYGTT